MQRASAPSKEEMNQLYAKLSQCNIKAVALRLINPFADQFIDQSRSVLIVSERSVCYKPVHSLALSSLFVCSVARLTAEIHSFLLIVVSSSFSSP